MFSLHYFRKLIREITAPLFTKYKFAKLTEALTRKEIIFRAPPFNNDIVKAIKLISPQYVLRTDSRSRLFWEREQNACCWGEYRILYEFLSKKPIPQKCLEIGPGMGRSVVFLTKKLDWAETQFHLYDSVGTKTKYTISGPRFADSFCSTLDILEDILKYNGVKNYKIFDAKDLNFKLDSLPGPYDVIYSFYAIGFHWGLEHFIDEIIRLMHETTLAFFLVPANFAVFKKLKQLNFKIQKYVAGYPKDGVNKILIISKGPL